MGEAIIKNYNQCVQWDDDVYILGDCMLGDDNYGLKCLRRLNGKKHLILGNHCTDARIEKYYDSLLFESIEWGGRLRVGKDTYLLSHYPQLTENLNERHKVISLCDHSHTKDPFLHWDKGMIYHCEVDAHDLYPVCIEQIVTDIQKGVD